MVTYSWSQNPKSSGLTIDSSLSLWGSRAHSGIQRRKVFWFLEEGKQQERKTRVEWSASDPLQWWRAVVEFHGYGDSARQVWGVDVWREPADAIRPGVGLHQEQKWPCVDTQGLQCPVSSPASPQRAAWHSGWGDRHRQPHLMSPPHEDSSVPVPHSLLGLGEGGHVRYECIWKRKSFKLEQMEFSVALRFNFVWRQQNVGLRARYQMLDLFCPNHVGCWAVEMWFSPEMREN